MDEEQQVENVRKREERKKGRKTDVGNVRLRSERQEQTEKKIRAAQSFYSYLTE
jgi:hypothetical protein